MTVLLEAVGLTKSFGSNAALRGADLTVQAGEIVAVLGPSGSGKSTLLHCVAGILPVDAGSLNYRGRSLTTMPDRERSALRRSDFGFIFQFGQLVGELTCRENLALPLRLGGAARRTANTAADDWLERLGVAEVADHRPGEISGGQAQRVAVGRAMIGGPRVIFADEPTGALDSLHGERVLTLLLEAVRNTGAAMVLVTHEARVAAYSDREVMVRDGRTAEAAAA
jgi:putative ABC transport system ATP-binding protein